MLVNSVQQPGSLLRNRQNRRRGAQIDRVPAKERQRPSSCGWRISQSPGPWAKAFTDQPHAEQEPQYVDPPGDLVEDHYRDERRGRNNDVFQSDACAPLYNEVADRDNRRLVQYVERQDTLVTVNQESVAAVKKTGGKTEHGEEPAPGVDGLYQCGDDEFHAAEAIGGILEGRGEESYQDGGRNDRPTQPDPSQPGDGLHYLDFSEKGVAGKEKSI